MPTATLAPSAYGLHTNGFEPTQLDSDSTRDARPTMPENDVAVVFARRVQERLNGQLVRCEERLPRAAANPVVVVVVERNPDQWQELLGSIHSELFGARNARAASCVRLEVIDRKTDEAIHRFVATGLMAGTHVATRVLYPEGKTSVPVMSQAEHEQAVAHRAAAAHKLRLAHTLGEAGFSEEARPALLDAIYSLGCAFAVEHRLPQPIAVYDAIIPPLAQYWKQALQVVTSFVRGSDDWRAVAGHLAGF